MDSQPLKPFTEAHPDLQKRVHALITAGPPSYPEAFAAATSPGFFITPAMFGDNATFNAWVVQNRPMVSYGDVCGAFHFRQNVTKKAGK